MALTRPSPPLVAGPRRALVVAAIGALIVVPLVAWADLSRLARASWEDAVRYLPLTVPTFAIFAAILVLERCWPADRSRPLLSRGLCEDVVWTLLSAPIALFGVFWFAYAIEWVFDHPLAGARTNIVDQLPFTIAVVICFVIGDGLAWVAHYLKHKVALIWRFHAVHHSARELNPFTDGRGHVVEFMVNYLVFVLPFFLIGGDVASGLLWLLMVRLWYSRLVHSNIRTNFGPLRHVLVTPQYHRTHHSIDPRHADQNFGAVFTIWDRMFRTQVADHDCYPVTGITDPSFPHATSRSPIHLLHTYWQQFTYPFSRRAAHFAATRGSRTSWS